MSKPKITENRKKTEESQGDTDLWNDPDLVPPPVVMDEDES